MGWTRCRGGYKNFSDTTVPIETVPLSDNSSDEYEDSRGLVSTESNNEPDAEDDDIPDATGAGLHYRSLTADKQTTNRVSTVRLLTTGISPKAALARQRPAARERIIFGRVYTLPVLPSSSVVQYSSPLAT